MAGVFASRGNYGLVLHGDDGLDELTTTTSSTVWVYADGEVERLELDPLTMGVPRAHLADLVGGDDPANAEVVREVVAGKPGPFATSSCSTPLPRWSRTASPHRLGLRQTSPTSWSGHGRLSTRARRKPSCRSGSRPLSPFASFRAQALVP